jgi:hypothetical protein
LTLVLGLALVPLAAEAQPIVDLAGLAGFFVGRQPSRDGPGFEESWTQAAQGGVVFGGYLSPHLKIEFEATGTTAGTRHVSRSVVVPGSPYPYWITSEQEHSVRSISAVAAWQFRDNEWVHPFLEAGLSADFDHVVVRTPEQFFLGDPRSGSTPVRVAETRTEESTTTQARGVIGGGAKAYFSERAFVRTDVRLTFDQQRLNLAFRGGVGFDF